MSTDAEKEAAAKAMIKAVFDDGEAEINGRKYALLKMTHKQRRKVFAYYTKVSKSVESNDMSFIDSPEFEKVEEVMSSSEKQYFSSYDTLLSKYMGILGDLDLTSNLNVPPGNVVPRTSATSSILTPAISANETDSPPTFSIRSSSAICLFLVVWWV